MRADNIKQISTFQKDGAARSTVHDVSVVYRIIVNYAILEFLDKYRSKEQSCCEQHAGVFENM